MLETVRLDTKLAKGDYRRQVPALQRRLHDLQRACHDARIASVIVFEGWAASGVSTTIRKLAERLEPRALSVSYTHPPRTHEQPMPWLWRFWMRLPNRGEMAVFDRSWYRAALHDRVLHGLDDEGWLQRQRDINSFEHGLASDRYEIIKVWLHIGPEEQRRRLEKLAADPLTSWQVSPEDWKRLDRRPLFEQHVEQVLAETETEWAPWTVVAATDKRWCRWSVFDVVSRRLEQALRRRGVAAPERPQADVGETPGSEAAP